MKSNPTRDEEGSFFNGNLTTNFIHILVALNVMNDSIIFYIHCNNK